MSSEGMTKAQLGALPGVRKAGAVRGVESGAALLQRALPQCGPGRLGQ